MSQEDDNRESTIMPYAPFNEFNSWYATEYDWNEFQGELTRFERIKGQASIEVVRDVIERIEREVAAESVAVEGFFELTPGESRSIGNEDENWEHILTEQSDTGLSIFESQLRGYIYAREHAMSSQPITEQFIRELHVTSCAAQKTYSVDVRILDGRRTEQRPLTHGEYKKTENLVYSRSGKAHAYAPPDEVKPEMDRLIQQLRGDIFESAPPVTQAAYAHYTLVSIHPFEDGNGRVARALASVFLYRAYGVPLAIYSDRKRTYLQALEGANMGRPHDFLKYIEQKITASFVRIATEIQVRSNPNTSDELASLSETFMEHRRVLVPNAGSVARAIAPQVISKFDGALSQLISSSAGFLIPLDPPYKGGAGSKPTYNWQSHQIADWHALGVELIGDTQIRSRIWIVIGVANDIGSNFPFTLAASTSFTFNSETTIIEVKLRFEDFYPDLSSNATACIETVVEATIAKLTASVNEELRTVLKQAGELEG
ncbi:Fic family protein [Kutzneria chonburiensis]|uniref:Fic family protein n=1 Tax=Kutzneria chonburiensis TaxID=1483604 RepID=A0ABV6MK20_9PSEU|nr:Fic family protein [Kutzneria chonburiensis]